MNQLQTVLSDIFDRGASKDLPAEFEPDLINAARGGNETALVQLMYAYAPALRSAYFTYSSVDADERQGVCVAAFYEALYAHDDKKGLRLAATLPYALQTALGESAAMGNIFNVPTRTLSRFFGFLREADGDVNEAMENCEGRGMTKSSFLAIHRAIQTPELLVALTNLNDDERTNFLENNAVSITVSEPIDEEDEELLDVAFSAVEPIEEQVIRLAYGFESFGTAQTDDEVGDHLGLGRMTVNRTRNTGLKKMRVAIGVAA